MLGDIVGLGGCYTGNLRNKKKRINSDHGPTGLGCDKRTQRTLHELFTPEEDVFQVIRLSHSYPMTDPNGAAIFVVRNMDPNKNPSHVSIFLPAPAGSVMAF